MSTSHGHGRLQVAVAFRKCSMACGGFLTLTFALTRKRYMRLNREHRHARARARVPARASTGQRGQGRCWRLRVAHANLLPLNTSSERWAANNCYILVNRCRFIIATRESGSHAFGNQHARARARTLLRLQRRVCERVHTGTLTRASASWRRARTHSYTGTRLLTLAAEHVHVRFDQPLDASA